MNHFSRHLSRSVVLFLLFTSACQPGRPGTPGTGTAASVPPLINTSATPTEVTSAIPTPGVPMPQEQDIAYFPLEGGEVLLWAAGASASSNAGETAYNASQATGGPDTFLCGDYVTAWQPSEEALEARIELDYLPHIRPNGIYIEQSRQPNQVSRVELFTQDDETLTIYDSRQEALGDTNECPASLYFELTDVDAPVRSVRIMVERDAGEAWTQIDAVGLTGLVGDGLPELEPTQVWENEEEPDDPFQPAFYSNKNRISTILFAGDTLWAAGDGGIVAWDLLGTGEPVPIHASPVATHALVYCDFAEPMIVAGGDKGIFTLSPPTYSEYGPYFQPLEHPEADGFGRVSALGCDEDLQQVWAGYAGHLSRYDMTTQSWKEYSVDDGLPGDSVRQIRVIDGQVWVATAAGIAVLLDGRIQEVYTPDNSGIPSQYVHAIGRDESSRMWIATSGGLASFDGQSWDLWPADEINASPVTDNLMSLRQDPGGSLWLADFFGSVCEFVPGLNQCRQVVLPPEPFNSLDAFDIDANGRLAIGSMTDGLWLYSEGGWTALRTRDQSLSNSFLAMAATPGGQVWLAGRDGLQRFQAAQPAAPWLTFPLPNNAKPHSFHAGSDGLWIGYTGGVRFVPYLEGQVVVDIPLQDQYPGIDNTVTAINRDGSGKVYFGLSTGLVVWNGTSLKYEDLRSDAERNAGKTAPRVNSVDYDGESMWVGTSNGLYRFRNGSLAETWKEELEEVSSQYSSSVGAITPYPRRDGLLVSIGRELFMFEGGRFTQVLELPGEIRSIAAGPYQLWLATAGSGFYSIPMDDSPAIYWEGAVKNEELPDRYGYQAICMTDAHTLWVASMESGLIRIPGMFAQ